MWLQSAIRAVFCVRFPSAIPISERDKEYYFKDKKIDWQKFNK